MKKTSEQNVRWFQFVDKRGSEWFYSEPLLTIIELILQVRRPLTLDNKPISELSLPMAKMALFPCYINI